jgi:hypothetical protein
MRRVHELIRNGLSAELYLHAFVKPDNPRSLAKRLYNTDRPDTSKVYPAIHSLTIEKYLKLGSGHDVRVNTKTLVDELNELLKTRDDSFTSREKKFLNLLFKKQEFVAVISRGILKKMDEQHRIKQQRLDELENQEKKIQTTEQENQNPSIPSKDTNPEISKIKEKKRGVQRTMHNVDALIVISDVLGMLANSFWIQPMLGSQASQELENDITDSMIKKLSQVSENKIEEEIEKYQKTWDETFPQIEAIFKMAAKMYSFIPNIDRFVDEFLFSFRLMPYLKSFVLSKPLIEKLSKLSQGQDAMQILKMFTEIKEKASSISQSPGEEQK